MRKIKIVSLILVFVLLFLTCCTSEKDPQDSSGETSNQTLYITPENEDLSFCNVVVNGQSDKTRAVNLYNPVNSLPTEDSIIFIDNVYDTKITVPEDAYCISLEKLILNSYKVDSLDIKTIEPKSGYYLIFIGDFNVNFAKEVYTPGLEIEIENTHKASSIVGYPSVIIDDEIHRVSGINPDSVSEDGIFVFDPGYNKSYTDTFSKDVVEIAIVNDLVAYVGDINEKVAIPGKDGFLVGFYGDSAIEAAKNIQVGQKTESVYLSLEKGAVHTIKFNDNVIYVNNTNSYRYEETTVVFTPDNGYNRTRTNEYGYEYVVSDGVVTMITEPLQEDSGNAEIPADGFVISTVSNAPEYNLLKELKVGDKVEIKTNLTQYEVITLPFYDYNTARGAAQTIIYTPEHGTSTGTNEWGYEIIVNSDGRIIGEDGDGDAEIPEGGFVLSGDRDPRYGFINSYRPGAKVIINDEDKEFSIIYTPMDDYENSLDKFELLKETAESAKNSLIDIDYDAVNEKIAELEAMIEQDAESAGTDKTELRLSFNKGVQELYRMLIPSYAVETRAAWHIPTEKNDEEVERTVDAALSIGLNQLIISIWRNGYANFHSQLDGVLIDPNYADYDVLEAFIRIGHQKGLEIHGCFTVFTVGSTSLDYPENHPVHNEGWLLESVNGYDYNINEYGEFYSFDPFNTEVREYLISILKEVVTNYDIDGINYDYIRFPKPSSTTGDFGYNENTIKAFQEKYNTTIDPATLKYGDDLWEEWNQFRCDIVSSFVQECTQEIKKIDEDIFVSAAVFADIDNMKYTIYQDSKKWAEERYLDALYPMNYTPSNDSFEKYANQAISATKDNVYLINGLGAYEMYPIETILWQIDYSRYNADGVSSFTLQSLLEPQYYNFLADGIFKEKAVPTYSPNAFDTAIDDLSRKINEIYLPYSDGFDNELNLVLEMLDSITKENLDTLATFVESNFDGVLLERLSESIDLLEKTSSDIGYRAD